MEVRGFTSSKLFMFIFKELSIVFTIYTLPDINAGDVFFYVVGLAIMST